MPTSLSGSPRPAPQLVRKSRPTADKQTAVGVPKKSRQKSRSRQKFPHLRPLAKKEDEGEEEGEEEEEGEASRGRFSWTLLDASRGRFWTLCEDTLLRGLRATFGRERARAAYGRVWVFDGLPGEGAFGSGSNAFGSLTVKAIVQKAEQLGISFRGCKASDNLGAVGDFVPWL